MTLSSTDCNNEIRKAEECCLAGKYRQAVDICNIILGIHPDHADSFHLLGVIACKSGDYKKAALLIQKAIQNNPANPLYYRSLGDVLKNQGKYKEAISFYKKTLEFMPDNCDTLNNMGNAYYCTGNLSTAISCYKKALLINPAYEKACNNMGKTFQDMGEINKALVCYKKSLRLNPDYAEAHFNLSVALLLSGDYSQGWCEYEWRFKRSRPQNIYPHRLFKPRWDGSPFTGKRLLVHAEQGLGDTLQFVRYIPVVKALGGTIIFETLGPLKRLMNGLAGIDELIEISPDQPPAKDYDYYIPLLSLPCIFKTTLDNIPSIIPYIYADQVKIEYWKNRIPDGDIKVGLVWAGKPSHENDRNRSIPLDSFIPLANIQNIRLYGLQKGGAAVHGAKFPECALSADLGEELNDFSDTAGVIENLDLLISVDTSVAHLAGAMGKPVWILLPYIPDWRWLLNREDSPWYPTARLFRQKKAGDWDEVLRRVAKELQNLVERDKDARHTASDIKLSETYYNMGNAAHNRNELKEAIINFQKAIKINPLFVQVYYNMGNVFYDMGNMDEAISAYERALVLMPDYVEAHFNMGNAFLEQGNPEKAILCYGRALRFRPDFADAHYNMGNAYLYNSNPDQAISSYQKAINLRPEFAEACNNAGTSFQKKGDIDKAIAYYQKAIKIDPDHAQAYYNLGKLFHDRHIFGNAISCYKKALEKRPEYAEAANNMGRALRATGDLTGALSCYYNVFLHHPESADAHFNLSLIHLLQGNFVEGWKEYEWRFKREEWKNTYPCRFKKPRWNGLSFKGKRLFVHSEQGMGDILQFVRYLPMVKAKGGTVIFETLKPLLNIFRKVEGIDELVEFRSDAGRTEEFDFHISLMSLPLIFKTSLKTIPARVPYLYSDPVNTDYWNKRLTGNGFKKGIGFKTGIVWAGTPTDPNRSCPLARLMPVATIPEVNLYGLQKGIPAVQAEVEGLPEGMKMTSLGEEFKDFSDTAAVIENMDLVISIDTSVAHLAGAMGKPVWVMLPFVSDWRWLLNRNDSPWYPTMRLFRQKSPGDWDTVCREIASELQVLVKGYRAPKTQQGIIGSRSEVQSFDLCH